MKTLNFLYLLFVLLTNCNSKQDEQLSGMWLIVQEDGHYVYDCHEVLYFDKNIYKIYDCDIDYSQNPTVKEQGRFFSSKKNLQLHDRVTEEKTLTFFLTANNPLNLEINKLSTDSLIVSYYESKELREFKFRRVKN